MDKRILMVAGIFFLISGTSGFCYAAENSEASKMPKNDAMNLSTTQDWDPVQEMENIRKKIDSIFKQSFTKAMKDGKMFMRGGKEGFDINMTVKETKSAFIVSADLPGMNKEEINVELKGHLLMISGQRKSETKTENEKVFKEEQSFGSFSGTVTLPDDVKTENINAEYKNGVLTVTVPRIEPARVTQETGVKIPVK